MSRRYWIALTAIGLALSSPSLSLGQEQPIEQHESDASQQEQGGEGQENAPEEEPIRSPANSTAAQPAGEVEAGSSEKADDYGEGQDDPSIMGDTPAQFWMMIASFLAVIVSAIAVFLVRETLKEAQAATRAATIGARLTKKALDHTRDSNRRSLRAYVCFKSVRLKKFKSGEPPEFLISSQNVGNTPAHNYRGWYAFSIIPNYKITEFGFRMGVPPRSRSVLGPGLTSGFGMEKFPPLTKQQVRTVAAGKCTLLVWGEDLYADIFGDEHYTRFRYEWTGPFTKERSMTISPDGNEAT